MGSIYDILSYFITFTLNLQTKTCDLVPSQYFIFYFIVVLNIKSHLLKEWNEPKKEKEMTVGTYNIKIYVITLKNKIIKKKCTLSSFWNFGILDFSAGVQRSTASTKIPYLFPPTILKPKPSSVFFCKSTLTSLFL